jgi:flagellar hook protein FlgE
MSLYGVMRTGVSGMNAQSGRLSSVADNIANADSIGYKRMSTEFSSMVLTGSFGAHQSGGTLVHNRSHAGEQGAIRYSTSNTDLAIRGNGFFVVKGPDGGVHLTRAGSFLPDAQGNLVNGLGHMLMGHPLENGAASAIANGFQGLSAVNVSSRFLKASPSTAGSLGVNLPSTATAVAAANLPSANAAGAQFTAKSSIIAHDSLGGDVTLDVYFTKTGPNTWEVAAFDRSKSTNGGFPYSSGPMSTAALSFDPATGRLAASSANSLSLAIPGGETLKLDLARTTQLANAFSVLEASINGNAPGAIDRVEINPDGLVVGVLRNGARLEISQLAIADVPSTDLMGRESGTMFSVNELSGTVRVGAPNSGGFGEIIGGALEESTVDIGGELTDMIQAQRTYTANSKAFMTGAELMDVLVNLKR